MPIRHEMRHLYPPPREWRELRARILERARHVCECKSECGLGHDGLSCLAPNGATIWRFRYNDPGAGWLEAWRPGAEGSPTGDLDVVDVRFVRVVLTISHRDHNPANNDPENLRALCQRCHLRYDRLEHARTRAARSK